MHQTSSKNIALFVDFRDLSSALDRAGVKTFDFSALHKRIVEKGKIVYKRAYADWAQAVEVKKQFHLNGVEMIDTLDLPGASAVRLAVDALSLANQNEKIDTFVIATCSGELIPLISKLREQGKSVVGIGVEGAVEAHVVGNFDEYIYVDALANRGETAGLPNGLNAMQKTLFAMVMDVVSVLKRETHGAVKLEELRNALYRAYPDFDTTKFGYLDLAQALYDVADFGLIDLDVDEKTRQILITDPLRAKKTAEEPAVEEMAAPKAPSSVSIAIPVPKVPAVKREQAAKETGEEKAIEKPAEVVEKDEEKTVEEETAPRQRKTSTRGRRTSTRRSTGSSRKKAEPKEDSKVEETKRAPKSSEKKKDVVEAEETPAKKEAKIELVKIEKARKVSVPAKAEEAAPAKKAAARPVLEKKAVDEKPAEKPVVEAPVEKPAVEPKVVVEPKAVVEMPAVEKPAPEEEKHPRGKPLKSHARRRRR